MKLFTAEWCAPCRQIKHMLEFLKHSVEVIDVHLKPDLAQAANVHIIPCLLLGDGTMVTGIMNIREEINKAYGKTE
jgi:thiol-disulfide isomerase/thioredoxin